MRGDVRLQEEPDAEQTQTQTQSQSQGTGGGVRSLARLHRPEWALLAGGGLASFCIGATMPAFAFLFSKLYGVGAGAGGRSRGAAWRGVV